MIDTPKGGSNVGTSKKQYFFVTELDIIREVKAMGTDYTELCISNCTSTDHQVAFAKALFDCVRALNELQE